MDAKQYDVYIEASIEADNDEDAAAIVKRLTERVVEHPCVLDAEGQIEPLAPVALSRPKSEKRLGKGEL